MEGTCAVGKSVCGVFSFERDKAGGKGSSKGGSI